MHVNALRLTLQKNLRRECKALRTIDEILRTRINIKFWGSKLGLEIKCNSQWIQIKYKIYMCYTDTI